MIVGYEFRTNGGEPVDVGLIRPTTVSGLTPGTTYDFEVRDRDEAGVFSAWSTLVSATTLEEMMLVDDEDNAITDDDGNALTVFN